MTLLGTCSGDSLYSRGDDSVNVVSTFPMGRMVWGHPVLMTGTIDTS